MKSRMRIDLKHIYEIDKEEAEIKENIRRSLIVNINGNRNSFRSSLGFVEDGLLVSHNEGHV